VTLFLESFLNDHSTDDLVDALQAGDDAAFAELVRRHQAAVLRMARRYARDPHVAEEVAQETWIAVLAGIARFERRSSLRTWILSIAKRKAFARYEPWTDQLEPDELVGRDGPDACFAAHELRGRIRQALAALGGQRQAVVALRDVDGYSAAEVAQALGITPGNVRVLLHRGRLQLAAELRAYVQA
jgi:RNA polymerase sigma-70 factor (ECF subfamily)